MFYVIQRVFASSRPITQAIIPTPMCGEGGAMWAWLGKDGEHLGAPFPRLLTYAESRPSVTRGRAGMPHNRNIGRPSRREGERWRGRDNIRCRGKDGMRRRPFSALIE